jgi:hypothetical protein
MSFEVRCPQCLFVSRQLGQPTPCLLHVSLSYEEIEPAALEVCAPPGEDTDFDEPYVFGQLHPTVDRPGPFTLREYVRLQLLRTRIQANPSRLDLRSPRAQARSLSRR